MKVLAILIALLLTSCGSKEKKTTPHNFSSVEVNFLLEDSISIRAIELMGSNLAFAGDNGKYGMFDSQKEMIKTNTQIYDSIIPEYRSVAGTSTDFFMLSVGNPALLYKTGDSGKMELVYIEENEKVFYDSMAFWNDSEGIAMGDPIDSCLSIIVTRDGGNNWKKLECSLLPGTKEGEAAFAASNSNIAIQGDHTWIISGGMSSRIFYSPDKAKSWKVYETPLTQGTSTTGGYSLDFYDDKNGIIIGGDYTQPERNAANIAVTSDGGKTWKLVAKNNNSGYKSSVRYVPNGNAREILSTGFQGISYSKDGGQSWKELSKEGFYTLRFLNDSVAYAAGKNRIAKLLFK